jgi:serine/threonine protein kinase
MINNSRRKLPHMDAISLLSGNKLAGRYRVLEKLGGSFAETFLSEDEHLPDAYRCVIKKLKTEVEEEAKLKIAKRLFDEEARTLHQLGSHPNIPQLLAHFEEDNEFYLVEEYVEGISLYQELSTGQRWSESYVVKLVKDLLDVLKFVHQKQVIHRDIKPSNIIRREKDGQIFLIDFGAVKQVTSQVADENTMAPHTVIVGTPGYMPGEQLRGSPRMSSDVFAVGMIAIYALTGLNPALGQVPEDEQTAEIIWRDRASVSPEFAAIIDKMVAYDFRQRYPSAQEAADAIQALTLHRQAGDGATVLSDRGVGFPMDRDSVGFPSKPAPEMSGTGTGSITYNGMPIGTENSGLLSPPSTALEKTSGTRPGEGSAAGTHVVFGMNPAQVVKPESSATSSPRQFLKPKYFALGGAAILGLGTIAALASPNIGPICKTLNNCSAEVKYNTVYEDSQDKAESALTAVNNAKTLQDLQNADTKLKESIGQLSKIPEVVHSYKDAQKVLPNYQKQLKSLEEKITAEKKAQQDLEQADVIAKPVLAQKKISGSVASLSENKAKLQTAIERVNKVPDKSLTASQGKVQKQAYLDRQKAIDAEIKKQAAIEAEQQRKWAAAEAERQRQQAAYKTRNQPSWNSANSGGGGGSSGGSWSGSGGGGGSSGHSSGGGGSSGGGWSGSGGGGGSSGHSSGGGSSSGGGGGGGSSGGGGGEQLWGNNSGSSSGSGSTSGGGEPLW